MVKLGKPIGRRVKGTKAVQREILKLEMITRQLKDAYNFQDIAGAFTLKSQGEQSVEKIAKLCRLHPNPACNFAPAAIERMRKAAQEFNRCRCPK